MKKRLIAILAAAAIMAGPSGLVVQASGTNLDKFTQEEEDADSLELLALVCMAEAEGEVDRSAADPYLGWRLVIDTVLNRVDDERFPDTIEGVVYQRGQFTSMWNGRVDRVELNDDVCRIVEEELEARTNSAVLYFTANAWPAYGEHEIHVGHHYFNK